MSERKIAAVDKRSGALAGAKIAFIGSGAMGEAMIGGLLAHRLVSPDTITASDPHVPRGEDLRARYGIHTTVDNREAARDADIVVLSVKPQVLRAVFKDLRGLLRPDALVISIIAGARIASIEQGLRHSRIVRTMPNTPAQVGEGMTVWIATAQVTPGQCEQVRTMLRALGQEFSVKEEIFLDMATAISGTGPAYVFLLMEALIDAAVHLGFSRAEARMLVLQTVRGTAAFALRSDAHPAELRNQVTSPGGTSAHAIYQLEKGGFRTVLSKAVWAAFQRSVALGALETQVGPFEDNDTDEEGS